MASSPKERVDKFGVERWETPCAYRNVGGGNRTVLPTSQRTPRSRCWVILHYGKRAATRAARPTRWTAPVGEPTGAACSVYDSYRLTHCAYDQPHTANAASAIAHHCAHGQTPASTHPSAGKRPAARKAPPFWEYFSHETPVLEGVGRLHTRSTEG